MAFAALSFIENTCQDRFAKSPTYQTIAGYLRLVKGHACTLRQSHQGPYGVAASRVLLYDIP